MNPKLAHIQYLGLADDKRSARLGLGFEGTNVGAETIASPEVINHFVGCLLRAGLRLSDAGVEPVPIEETTDFVVTQATQVGACSLPDGRPCLVLRFGPIEVAAVVSTTDIRPVLELMEKASLGGGFHPAPKDHQ